MNVRKIAELSGVSPASVSRYFTGTASLSNATYEKIDKVVRENGFVSVEKAKNQVGTVCVILPEPKYVYHMEIVNEIILQSVNYLYYIVFVPAPKNDFGTLKQMISKNNVVGIIVVEDLFDTEFSEIVEKSNIQTVICGSSCKRNDIVSVVVNDIAASYMGMNYLLSLGHKKVCIFSENTFSIDAGFKRQMGVKRALEEQKIELDNKYIRCGEATYRQGYAIATEILEEKLDITAIFAFSDEMAIGAINAIFDKGLKVPEDFSVLGFDGLKSLEIVRPTLTTIEQPIKEIVKATLNIFSDNGSAIFNGDIVLMTKIREGNSCVKIDWN